MCFLAVCSRGRRGGPGRRGSNPISRGSARGRWGSWPGRRGACGGHGYCGRADLDLARKKGMNLSRAIRQPPWVIRGEAWGRMAAARWRPRAGSTRRQAPRCGRSAAGARGVPVVVGGNPVPVAPFRVADGQDGGVRGQCEFLFRKAVLHRQAGRSAEAEACWRRVLTLRRPEPLCSVDQGIYSPLTLGNLAAPRGLDLPRC